MVLTTDQYDAAYFGDTVESGGLRHDAGYSDYLEATAKNRFNENNPTKNFNPLAEEWKKLLENEGLENAAIIELGGGTGTLAAAMLEDGFDWTVVDVANWCFRHKEVPDENFIEQEAIAYLEAQGNNSIEAIVSSRFLVCFDDATLVNLISLMRSKSQQQVHIIDENPNGTFYNVRTLQQWLDDFNWPNNQVTLISKETGQILRT